MKLQHMSNEEKMMRARKFREDHPSGQLSREEFELYLLDHGFVEDPGTDDRGSNEHKGFMSGVTRARGLLNRWAEMLPPEEAFKIVSAAHHTRYFLVDWDEAAREEIRDFANSIDRMVSTRVSNVGRKAKVAHSQLLMASTEDARVMSARIKLYTKQAKALGIQHQQKLAGENALFNEKLARLERMIDDVTGGDDAGTDAA